MPETSVVPALLCTLTLASALQAVAERPVRAPAAGTLAARLDSVASAYARRGELSGVVLVADHGAVVYEHAFGDANREWHVPNTVATRFRIASTTKQFTAALVLRLVEQGKLRLDAHIADYLPDYPRPQGQQVTLEQLLTHSSGLPDYPHLPRFYEDQAARSHTTPELLALFDSLPLEFTPGSKWSYSNSGYVVLGAIIERVTGTTYAKALRELLLTPLGLGDTGFDDPADVVERRAAGYLRTAGRACRTPRTSIRPRSSRRACSAPAPTTCCAGPSCCGQDGCSGTARPPRRWSRRTSRPGCRSARTGSACSSGHRLWAGAP